MNRLRETFPREYAAWSNAVTRCGNPRCVKWPDYGGRGIQVCLRWRLGFSVFLEDMGPCPPGFTLERRDFDGDYAPDNCRWASRVDQARNKRNTRLLTFRGETRCVSEWSEVLGLPEIAIRRRLDLGWDVERTLATPVEATARGQQRARPDVLTLTFRGESRPLPEWAERVGISRGALLNRILRGWTTERALTEPVGAARRR